MDYTMPQLDFILEMAAIESPDVWKFTRTGDVPSSRALARWQDSLVGKALMQLRNRTGLTAALENLQAFKMKSNRANLDIKPGFTRGGKGQDDGSTPDRA